jgi:hypothetical protein
LKIFQGSEFDGFLRTAWRSAQDTASACIRFAADSPLYKKTGGHNLLWSAALFQKSRVLTKHKVGEKLARLDVCFGDLKVVLVRGFLPVSRVARGNLTPTPSKNIWWLGPSNSKVAALEMRCHLLTDDFPSQTVRQNPFQAITHLDPYFPVLFDDKQDDPVVFTFLPDLPFLLLLELL